MDRSVGKNVASTLHRSTRRSVLIAGGGAALLGMLPPRIVRAASGRVEKTLVAGQSRVAIDWGVYGVPETFVIDRRGYIAFKQVGAITPAILETTILPLVARLRTNPPAPTPARR